MFNDFLYLSLYRPHGFEVNNVPLRPQMFWKANRYAKGDLHWQNTTFIVDPIGIPRFFRVSFWGTWTFPGTFENNLTEPRNFVQEGDRIEVAFFLAESVENFCSGVRLVEQCGLCANRTLDPNDHGILRPSSELPLSIKIPLAFNGILETPVGGGQYMLAMQLTVPAARGNTRWILDSADLTIVEITKTYE